MWNFAIIFFVIFLGEGLTVFRLVRGGIWKQLWELLNYTMVTEFVAMKRTCSNHRDVVRECKISCKLVNAISKLPGWIGYLIMYHSTFREMFRFRTVQDQASLSTDALFSLSSVRSLFTLQNDRESDENKLNMMFILQIIHEAGG